jgi:hypothetical protein
MIVSGVVRGVELVVVADPVAPLDVPVGVDDPVVDAPAVVDDWVVEFELPPVLGFDVLQPSANAREAIQGRAVHQRGVMTTDCFLSSKSAAHENRRASMSRLTG